MCPYEKANRLNLIKELHKSYLKEDPNNWLPPAENADLPTPTDQHVVVNGEPVQSQTSCLAPLAQKCVTGKVSHASCSETFHGKEAELARVLHQLEEALETPLNIQKLGQKILNQSLMEPASVNRVHIHCPNGAFTFWASVGYHENSTTLDGKPTYGIRTHIGFSFQKLNHAEPKSEKQKLTSLLNPKKSQKSDKVTQRPSCQSLATA